ncbi:hypothetical protein CR203_10600 [Salipaludibacillus neizhouensis]|uniref:Uncharacterized protein n=1 Tax=Salipaludibacillus neizhouensis TaxID=885475 RepID=A0A3A9K3Z6_9BACI|nr:hypothetical protein [Salipaludibacillus neizhouensis]RKL67784.1 hypothetical protein CR203_10600 [Salipaludibacillus neizhouensis]
MEKLIKWIGLGIFIGWSLAILVNYSIYMHATSQLTLVHPMVDGILFMALMFGIYVFIWRSVRKKVSIASFQLGAFGAVALVLAVIFAI